MNLVRVDCICTCGFRIQGRYPRWLSVIECSRCGKIVNVTKPIKGKPSYTKKRSQQQEKNAAKRYGGRVQPGSGAMDHAKGDIREIGQSRGECKFTSAKSFSLKLEQMLKIESEASGEELPFMELEFQGVHPYRRFVILPDWAFETLLERSKSAENSNTDD